MAAGVSRGPITKLTWDNAAFVSPHEAKRLKRGVRRYGEAHVRGLRGGTRPAYVQPGMANGHGAAAPGATDGRTAAGRRSAIGLNPYGLRRAKALWSDGGLDVVKASGFHDFFERGRNYHALETPDKRPHHPQGHPGRVQEESGIDSRKARKFRRAKLTMYPEWDYSKGYAWGMAIDLNSCNRLRRVRGGVPGRE